MSGRSGTTEGETQASDVERPVWFGPMERPLFGWVHHPAGGHARGAVVLCPPLAREWTNAHYCYRLLAQKLAAAGLLAVRFDYDGTGDSAGDDDDADRVAAWITSVEHAVALARQAGPERISLVGMRMGALFAAVAAARLDTVDAVVLWDPCSSARAFIREQSALQRMVLDGPAAKETTELPGAVLTPKTVADLVSLEVGEPRRPPARVLLLNRANGPATSKLADSLGAPVERIEALAQDRLLEVDLAVREMPEETMGDIVDWLAGPAVAPVAVSACGRDQATISVGGAIVTERAVRIGPVGLFGIVTEPEQRTAGTPSVLFLNSGNNSHVGPSRLWVDLARRWAAHGVRCVRMDESALGDSPTRPGQVPQVVRVPENFDDLEDARAAIEPGDPGNVVLVGLCTGGYQALESALAWPVKAVYAINPVLHFTPPELESGGIDPRRRICWPTGGLVNAYKWLAIDPVRRRLRRFAWGLAHLVHKDRNPSGWLDELQAHGADVLILCGEDEARSFGAGTAALAVFATGSGPITVDVIAGLDHALVPAWQRRDVADKMTDRLLAHHLPRGTLDAGPREAAGQGLR